MAANAACVTVEQLLIQVSFEEDSIVEDSNISIATVPNKHRLGKWIITSISKSLSTTHSHCYCSTKTIAKHNDLEVPMAISITTTTCIGKEVCAKHITFDVGMDLKNDSTNHMQANKW